MDKLDLFNIALAHLGEAAQTSLDAKTAEIAALETAWPIATHEILMRVPLNFARVRVTLLPEAVEPPFGYIYQYALPADFVTFVSVNGEEWERQTQFIQIEGRNILANVGKLNVVYIARQDLAANWPETSLAALSLKLAELSCPGIKQDMDLQAMLSQKYEIALSDLGLANASDNGTRRSNYIPALRPFRRRIG